jgi:hypothetical protein
MSVLQDHGVVSLYNDTLITQLEVEDYLRSNGLSLLMETGIMTYVDDILLFNEAKKFGFHFLDWQTVTPNVLRGEAQRFYRFKLGRLSEVSMSAQVNTISPQTALADYVKDLREQAHYERLQ